MLKHFLASLVFATAASAEPKIIRDLSYLGEDRTEKADLYLPAALSAGVRVPVVLVIHGGGWISGDKGAKREINICTTLAEHGYAALTINYHLAPKENPRASWPQNIRDAKSAVRWLRANADRYGLDAAHIGVIGGSAGGHLASLLGVTGRAAPFDVPEHASDDSAHVSAVVDLYGPIQLALGPLDSQSDLATSPLSYLDRSNPPFLVIHGTADSTVDVERSREFAAALGKAGVEHELVIVAGAPHTFDLQPAQRDLRPLVLGFFDRHLKR